MCANYAKHNDVLYPPVLQAALWLVIYIVYLSSKAELIQVANRINYIIIGGVFFFSVGGCLATYGLKFSASNAKPTIIPASIYNKYMLDILFYFSLVMLPFFIYSSYSIGKSTGADQFFVGLRIAMIDDTTPKGSPLWGYLVPISMALVWCQIIIKQKMQKPTKLYLSLFIVISYAFFSTARTSFFIFIIVAFGILAIMRRISISKALIYLSTLLLGVFIAVGTFFGKGINDNVNFIDNINSLLLFLKSYLVASIPALDIYIDGLTEVSFGKNTFRIISAILNAIGFNFDMPPLRQEFVNVPLQTNVYTLYQPYISDFGYFGVIIIQLVAGFTHGYFYRKAVLGVGFFVALYSIMLYPLFMQFFDDQYFRAMSLWLQFTIIFSCVFNFKYKNRKLSPSL